MGEYRFVKLTEVSIKYLGIINDFLGQLKLKYEGLVIELWTHEGPSSFITQNEFLDFHRRVQVSICQDENGFFVAFIPDLVFTDRRKRKQRVVRNIPTGLIRRIYFPKLHAVRPTITDDNFKNFIRKEFVQAWRNSYYLTPAMLDQELDISPHVPIMDDNEELVRSLCNRSKDEPLVKPKR